MANEKRLIDANALNRKKKYSFQTVGGCFHKSEWFIKADDLFSAPTVDAVEVVHAKWLDGYGVCDNKKSYISIDCSNCGEYFKIPGVDEDIEKWKKRFAYCPFCGAKRDGDGNG